MPKEQIEQIFNASARERLLNAIEAAESHTSGQIRLHVEARCKEDVLDHAAFIFEKLEMYKTKERNAVLFYFSLIDHKFAILGDAGINQKVPEGFWNGIRDAMIEYFKKGAYIEGLETGIRMAGKELAEDFPKGASNNNELSDEISFGV